jgi:hypothetical protein
MIHRRLEPLLRAIGIVAEIRRANFYDHFFGIGRSLNARKATSIPSDQSALSAPYSACVRV